MHMHFTLLWKYNRIESICILYFYNFNIKCKECHINCKECSGENNNECLSCNYNNDERYFQ